jgi:hypothetical protein
VRGSATVIAGMAFLLIPLSNNLRVQVFRRGYPRRQASRS